MLLLLSLSLFPYFLQGRVKTLGCGKSSGLQGKSAGYAVPLTLALSLALSLSLSLLLQGMRGLRNPPVSLSLSLLCHRCTRAPLLREVRRKVEEHRNAAGEDSLSQGLNISNACGSLNTNATGKLEPAEQYGRRSR